MNQNTESDRKRSEYKHDTKKTYYGLRFFLAQNYSTTIVFSYRNQDKSYIYFSLSFLAYGRLTKKDLKYFE